MRPPLRLASVSNPAERAHMFREEAKQNAETWPSVEPLQKSATVDAAADHDVSATDRS